MPLSHIRLLLTAALALVATSPAAAEVKLRVLEWEGYIGIHKEAFEAHAKAQGKSITLELVTNPDGSIRYIGSVDDIVEVLEAGGADIVTPTVNYYKQEQSRLMGLLAPIDTARLANYGALKVKDLALFQDDAGRSYGVPYVGGSYALAFNADKVQRPTSWAVLLSPAAKGRYQITGEQFEANVYQAAILAGVRPADVYDHTRWTPAQTARVQEILNTLVANSAGFWGGLPATETMADLDYVTDYWFGVAAANAAGQKWRIMTGGEPSTLWLDAISIAKPVAQDPAKLEAAHLLLDYLIGDDAQLLALNSFGSVIVNGKAHLRAGGGIDPETFFKPDLFWQPLSTETRTAFRGMWQTALTAAGR